MRAGQLNQPVVIQQRSSVQNALGERVAGWVDVASVWAHVIKKSGYETIRSDMELSITHTSIRIHYRSDITAAMRVVLGAEVYDIRAVLADSNTRRYTDLVCELGASNG